MKFKNYKIRITAYFLSILLLAAYCLPLTGHAQMSRKPSAMREPAGAMSEKPDSTKNSLPEINSQEEFDLIARTYHQGTPYALPHTMIIIDRRAQNNIYVDTSQHIRFHKAFLIAS